jgi:hypothetical protein
MRGLFFFADDQDAFEGGEETLAAISATMFIFSFG